MRLSSWLLLLVAFCLGISSAFVVAYFTLDAKPIQVVDRGPMTKILIAQRDIALGAEIEANDVTYVDVPISEIPSQSLMNYMDVFHRRPAYPIPVGCPICEDLLIPKSQVDSESVKFIPAGSQLVSLEVEQLRLGESVADLEIPISNLLSKGDRIDIRVTPREEPQGEFIQRKHQLLQSFNQFHDGHAKEVGDLVLENVPIHSVYSRSDSNRLKAKQIQTFSLLLDNADAEKLLTAAKDGRLRIIPHVEQKNVASSTSDAQLSAVTVKQSDASPIRETAGSDESVRLQDSSKTAANEIPSEIEVSVLSSIDTDPLSRSRVSFTSPRIASPSSGKIQPETARLVLNSEQFNSSSYTTPSEPVKPRNSSEVGWTSYTPSSEDSGTIRLANKVDHYSPFSTERRQSSISEEDEAMPEPPLKLRVRGNSWK